MKKHFKRTVLVVMALVLLTACAFVTMIVASAEDYCTVRIDYLFADGETAYDSYVAVFEKGSLINIDVNNPVISGYKAIDSPDESTAQPAPTTHLECDLNDDLTLKVYYVPVEVPYSVKYYLQNIYDDDFTPTQSLDDEYYNKSGLTGTFPDELSGIAFDGFTKLYHKPDFIAADGSTEFELYYTRNYYLINFDLDGGHGVEPVYAKYQSVYNIAEPTKKGYVFEGWVLSDKDGHYVDEEGNILTDDQAREAAEKFTSGIVPDHNVNYKAYWSAGETFYSIVYWVEDADSTNYTDVASRDVYHYKNGDTVMTGATISVTDTNTVPDFFTDYNLNPQKVQRDSQGNVILDSDLRPTYLTSADLEGYEEGDPIYPIDEYDHEIDFPEMSPGEREELNGKWRYFEIDTEKTISSMTVSGDGTTRYNVYYKRKPITQRFFFARKTAAGKYQVPGWTKAFSNNPGTLDNHLLHKWGDKTPNETHWMELSTELPQIADKYKNKLQIKTYEANDCTYYYYEMQTEYYSNMRDTWLTDAFDPYLITNNKSEGEGDSALFGAWSVEWGTPYAKKDNKTVKGFYEKLDDQLLYTEEYLQESEQNGYGADPLVLNYLSFWANSKNKDWNKKTRFYNFTYQNYVELLPSEYDNAGNWNGTGGYTSVIAVEYNVDSNNQVMHSNRKLYGLLPKNTTETYDGAMEYTNVNKRDGEVKDKQTAAALTGFELLTDAEIAKVKDNGAQVVYSTDAASPVGTAIDLKKQNPVCSWYAKNGFNDMHHADIKFFYRRRYYSLEFMNNNVHENSAAHTRNIYYQSTINSTGIRGNWVYFEPEYPDEDMRNYYYFDGWYFDEDHTEKIPVMDYDPAYDGTPHEGKKHFNSDFTMPPDDVTLFAKWNLVTEDVRFYNNYEAYIEGEDPVSSCVVEYNSMVLTQDIPTTNPEDNRPVLTPPVEGATFTGWYYIDVTGTELRFEPENIPVVKELNLYAKWISDQTADYLVEYVEKGTDNAVAASDTGVAYVTSTKSFRAKVNNELDEDHRPQEGQKNWWPLASSHSILIKSNDESDNAYRFEYVKKDLVWYKVRYLDAVSLEPLFDDEEKSTSEAMVSETYKAKENYIPDRVVKLLAPAASAKSDPDEAKADELKMNVIVFLYNQNDTEALVRVEHLVQNVDGDPAKKEDYTLYRTERFAKQINTTLNMETEVYGSSIADELKNSHYVINESLTEVNGAAYTGQEITVDGGQLVVKVYYKRNNYPYKVVCVDMDRDDQPDGILKTTVYDSESERKPMGAVVTIVPESPLEVNGETYLPISDAAQTLTIFHEVLTADDPEPKINVKTIYYKKQTSVQLNYVIVCEGAVEGDLQLSQNYEIVSTQADINGCTATDYSEVEGRYEFLGWYKTPQATAQYLLTTNNKYVPQLPFNDTTYYAVFKMNSAPYTLNYTYQGRAGGNDGSYVGDDADSDEKVYSVSMELSSDEVDENGVPTAQLLVEHAPAVDDLYKDCVWTIDSEHISFDKASYTVTITAVQTAKKCAVVFCYNDTTLEVQRVPINSPVLVDGKFVEALESDGENPFAYWSVTQNGKEIARCTDREFDLRITGDCTVTACYEAQAQKLYISDPAYSREQTTDVNGKVTDKLYADFILAYMEENGKLLNPKYGNEPDDTYRTGLIVEYDLNIRLEKEDAPGAILSDQEKVIYPSGDDVLSISDAQKLANGETLTGAAHQYICYSVANDKYNNHNRVDKAISFINSEAARHLVMRAYYYVWNTTTGEFEMTDPVYFYLYDIGNSIVPTE